MTEFATANEPATVDEPWTAFDGVSFDLFGTLVAVERPPGPAAAVTAELKARDLPVPTDWSVAYAEPHVDLPAGAECPLPEHVAAALTSRCESLRAEAIRADVERAVVAAFDANVETRAGAARTVAAVADRLPVGILSNCSVPSLAERVLGESDVNAAAIDAVVSSVDCGWRKPDPRAFEAVSDRLGIDRTRLLHVGDDPAADGGAEAAGATSVVLEEASLPAVFGLATDWQEGRDS